MSAERAALASVWVVDDSTLEADLCRRALEGRYAVEVFSGGEAALERLASGQHPDTLVLDWYMPDISGLEVCSFIRKSFDRAALPILVLTAADHRDDLLASLSAGANDYVHKPFDAAELVARTEALVERKQRNDQFHQDAALRERFIGILGHDLRQPLNSVAMGAQVLLAGGLAERDAVVVRRLARATERMSRMISDMLDLTKSRLGGGIAIERKPTDLRGACDQVVAEIRMGHPNAAISFSSSGETTGTYDRDRIIQLVTNLVANALEHGRAEEPIDIALEGGEQNATITVANGRAPIPREILARLFDPFRVADMAKTKGLGLGLFIVEQIARGHDGSVSVESNDETTRFVVVLPRAKRETRSVKSD
jgi:two-component system, sensor histidine kinase and response regulator